MNLLIIDTETTGLSSCDEPIEIGMVLLALDEQLKQIEVVSEYSDQRYPSVPISRYAKTIHKISEIELIGKAFNHQKILSLINLADILVAHNAKFDAGMLGKIYPEIYKKSWRCTYTQWPWSKLQDKKLSTIAEALGVNNGKSHRAIDDARTLAKCLSLGNYAIKIIKKPSIDLGAQSAQIAHLLSANEPPPVLGIDFDKLVELNFLGTNFCITGTFAYGERSDCEKAICAMGGVVKNTVTKKTDVLVVGKYRSSEWKFESFGSKIEKALELRSQREKIKIINEDLLVQFLDFPSPP